MYKKAVKLVLLKSSSLTTEDYKQQDILPLQDRLTFNKAVFMHNVVNGNAPRKIKDKFQINANRHTHLLSFPRPKNNIFKSSLLYSGGDLWNKLPPSLKSIKTKSNFKKKFKSFLFSKLL